MTNWPTRRLGDLADVRTSNVDKKVSSAETPVQLCNYMDVYSNTRIERGMEFMSGSASRSEIRRFSLERGDVIITKDSESPDDIGVPAVVVDDIDGLVCGYHLSLIRPTDDELNPVYLAEQIRADQSARYFGVQANGSTRFGLSIAAIENLEVPFPPGKEQEKIAEVLSTLDNAIEQSEALIAKQEKTKTGLMQSVLAAGIDEDGRLRSEETHAFNDSLLGRIPVEWEPTSIGEQFTERKERGRPGLPTMSIVMNHGLVERASVDRRVETALAPEQHALVREGDIAYNMMRMWQGVLGRASFDCLVSPAYVVLQPAGSIDSRFAEWLFRDARSVHAFRNASQGVVDDRLRLYPKDLFPIPLAVPRSTEEQSRIADCLDAQLASIQSGVDTRDKLLRLRVGLRQALLTGRVRVTPLSDQQNKARA